MTFRGEEQIQIVGITDDAAIEDEIITITGDGIDVILMTVIE